MANETTGYTIEIDGGDRILIPYPEKLYVESGVFVRSPHLQSLRKTKIRELLSIKSNDDDFDSFDDQHHVLINGERDAWEYFSKIIERPYTKFEENVEPNFNYKPGDIFRADLTFYLSDHEKYNTDIYEQSKYWEDQWGNRTPELYQIINMFKDACWRNGYNVDITNVYYLLSHTKELSNLQVLRSGNYQTVEHSFNYGRKLERIVRNYIQHIRIYFEILAVDDNKILTDGYKITQGFNGAGGSKGLATVSIADRHFYWANYGSHQVNWDIKPANEELKMEVKIGYDVNVYQSTNDQAFVYSLTPALDSNIYKKIKTKRIDINGKNGESIYKVTDPDDIYDENDGTKYLDRGVFDFFCVCTTGNSADIFAEFSSYQVPFDAGAIPFTSNPIKEESWVDETDGNSYVKWHFSNLIFSPDSSIDKKYQMEIYAYCPEGDLDSNIHYAGAGKMTVSMEGQNIGRYNLNVMDTLRRYGH